MATEPPGTTILFIDDDGDLVHALTGMLESEGYRVRHAADGEQGVRAARQRPPDLILMDFVMPVKDGFEACGELRQVEALRDVPILAITSFGQDLGELRGLGREGDSPPGFQDYLEKPIEPNVLLERIASALAARGAGKPAGA